MPVLQVPVYHLVMLAEDLARLDILTRVRFARAGAGYREDEFTALGVDFSQRFAMFEESIDTMKQMWTEDVVSFHGKFWSLNEWHTHIQPYQDQHPPIWIGATKDHGARRSARPPSSRSTPSWSAPSGRT